MCKIQEYIYIYIYICMILNLYDSSCERVAKELRKSYDGVAKELRKSCGARWSHCTYPHCSTSYIYIYMYRFMRTLYYKIKIPFVNKTIKQ